MTTGYTAYIQKGVITTGKDFLKLCLSNFDIAINMKNELLSNVNYDKAVQDRDNFKKLTFEQVRQQLVEKQKEDIEFIKESLDKYKAEDKRYFKIKEEIENWIPPTPEHENLRKFALEQINMSLNTDKIEYYNEKLNLKSEISDEDVYTYINHTNFMNVIMVESAYKNWQNDLKRIADKNIWMEQFLDSVDNISIQKHKKDREDEL